MQDRIRIFLVFVTVAKTLPTADACFVHPEDKARIFAASPFKKQEFLSPIKPA